MNNKPNPIKVHNPVEKVLEMYLLGCDIFQLKEKKIISAMDKAIKLSNAKSLKRIVKRFDVTSNFKGKNFPCGISIVYILSESHAALHTSPEHSYLSLQISTCGNKSHPFSAVGHLLEVFNPIAGNISYSKVGMDLINESRIFPKKLKTLSKRYAIQMNKKKFIFRGHEELGEPGDYSIYFWNPKQMKEDELRKHFKITKKQFKKYVPL